MAKVTTGRQFRSRVSSLGWLRKLPEVGAPVTQLATQETDTLAAMDKAEADHRAHMADLRTQLAKTRAQADAVVKECGWADTDVAKAKADATPHQAQAIKGRQVGSLPAGKDWCGQCGADVDDPVHI